MKKNVGSIDKVIRIVLGAGITSLAFWGPQSPWAYLGLILIITGFINYCPIWHALGVNSNKKVKTEKL